MSKLNTVNVIEVHPDGYIQSVRSFDDTPEGNKAAEELFVSIVKDKTSETAYNPEELQAMLDDGVFDDQASMFDNKLFLVHSNRD